MRLACDLGGRGHRQPQALARRAGQTFAILGEESQPGGDELTPTMKLRRKPIAIKYAERIDALYAERRPEDTLTAL